MNKPNVSIIAVDVVSPNIDQFADVVKQAVEELARAPFTKRVYETSLGHSPIVHVGDRQERRVGESTDVSRYANEALPGYVALVGGSLDGQLYSAFNVIVKEAEKHGGPSEIFLPLNCIWQKEATYEFGEPDYMTAATVTLGSPFLAKYQEVAKQAGMQFRNPAEANNPLGRQRVVQVIESGQDIGRIVAAHK